MQIKSKVINANSPPPSSLENLTLSGKEGNEQLGQFVKPNYSAYRRYCLDPSFVKKKVDVLKICIPYIDDADVHGNIWKLQNLPYLKKINNFNVKSVDKMKEN